MAFTRRGKLIVVVTIVLVVAVGAVVVVAATGRGPEFVKKAAGTVGIADEPPPPPCPLTGEQAPGGRVPERPALAIKVENLPEARPQYGLDTADIVYEEPVEGGITRFIVIYQCRDANRVEPVRSARTTDPAILVQYGTPVFGYADAAGYVLNEVARVAAIDDVNWQKVPNAYQHDSSRTAPHDLYTSTKALYKAAKKGLRPPEPVFTYAEEFPGVKARKARDAHLYFSDYSDVRWKWKPAAGGSWLRYHGAAKHVVADDGQVRADNVLVQVVDLKNSKHLDPAGNPVPEVQLTGTGKAFLLRDGQMITGKWARSPAENATHFTTRSGQDFVLKPGTTWIELYPSDRPKVTV